MFKVNVIENLILLKFFGKPETKYLRKTLISPKHFFYLYELSTFSKLAKL